MTGFGDARISYEKHARAAVFARELANLRNRSSAKNNARARGEIKWRAGADEM